MSVLLERAPGMYWQFIVEYSASKFAALPLWSALPIVGLPVALYLLHRGGAFDWLLRRLGVDARVLTPSPKIWIALGSILVFSLASGGIGFAIQEGYLFPATVVGRISSEACRDLSNVWVAAFFEDSKQSVATAPVDRNGFFRFVGLRNRRYSFVAYEIRDDRLYMSRFSIDAARASDADPAHEFPHEVFRIAPCGPIYYDSAQYELDERARTEIETCRGSLAAEPQIVLWIGHADAKGGETANLQLGSNRAFEAERAARAGSFASDANQMILSFGESRPAESGTHAAALASNRRVEIIALYRDRLSSHDNLSSPSIARKR